MLTAYELDSAVVWFGLYVEGKLNERDPKTFKPLHKLEEFVYEEKAAEEETVSFDEVVGLTLPPTTGMGYGIKRRAN